MIEVRSVTVPPGRPAAHMAVLPAALPRRAAMVVAPEPGEAFASWLDRFASDLGIPPGVAALEVGLDVRDRRGDVRPMFYGLAISPTARTRVAAATGLQPAAIDDMHLARFDGTALDLGGLDLTAEPSVRKVVKREWFQLHGSRACPRCLAESPAWQVWWRLGIAAVCPRHRTLLVARCPACGIELRRGYSHHPRGLSRVTLPDLTRCGNHLRAGQRCAQRLADVPTPHVGADLATAQHAALDAADGRPPTVAGTVVRPADWFDAVKLLAAMIRFGAAAVTLPARHGTWSTQRWLDAFAADYQQRRNEGKINPGALRASPQRPERAAGLLAVCHHILGASAPETCRRVEPIVTAVSAARRRLRGHNPMRITPAPESLRAVLDELTPPSSRVAGAIPCLPDVGLGTRHLPQLLPPADYRELVAAYLPATAEPTGRRLAALASARVLGASSWPDAARRLDMDADKAHRAADVLVRRITDVTGFWEAITEAVHRHGRRLRIDYAARRHHLADLYAVPAQVLQPTCRALGYPVTPARCRHAAAWIWQS
jgi:TniQ protein